MTRILIVGAGFAGLSSALGAAHKLDRAGRSGRDVEVRVIAPEPFHDIRVRNYEPDLSQIRIPLGDVLDPIGVSWSAGAVERIDVDARCALVRGEGGPAEIDYDRLVLAAGAPLRAPALPGLAEYAFDIDTYRGAQRLHRHLGQLGKRAGEEGQYTVVVVGAGLVGIELACELPAMLRAAGAPTSSVRVILVDRAQRVGSAMGPDAQRVIEDALHSLDIETRLESSVSSVDREGVSLAWGDRIAAHTVVWCGGMKAHGLASQVSAGRGGEIDDLARVVVDEHLMVRASPAVFAAGDVASALLDGEHRSVMSCQHARPMGRYAGFNAASDLLGEPPLAFSIEWYVTVIDLGPWGALYTEGWDRRVVAVGPEAKRTKRDINCQRIVPPRGDRGALLAAGAPVVQTPPVRE